MNSALRRGPRRPVLWVALMFAAGVWAGTGLAARDSVDGMILVAVIVLSLCALAALRRARWLFTCAAIVACGTLRAALPEWIRSPRDARYFTSIRGEVLVSGRVAAEPDIRPSGVRVVIHADSLARQEVSVPLEGRVVARFTRDPGLAYGDRLILAGRLDSLPSSRNPGEFDYGAYLRRRGIGAELVPARWRPVRCIARDTAVSWTGSIVAPLRGWIRRQVYGHLAGEPAALVLGLIFGEKEAMSETTVTAFQETGTLHLLAVSGSNVAVIVAVVWGFLTFARVPRLARIAMSLFGVVLFCHLAHNEVSVVRASIAAALVLTGLAAGRNTDAFGVWGGALLIQLLWDPSQLFEVGFQLSFLATLGILMLNPLVRLWPPARGVRGRALRALVLALSVSVAAQIATLPVLAYAFNRVPLVTPLANLICVPLAGMATAAGAVTLLLAPLGEPLLSVLCATTWLCVQSLLAAVAFFDGLALPVWQPASPSWTSVIVYAGALGSLYVFLVVPRWRRRTILAAIAASALVHWSALRAYPPVAGIILDTGSDPVTLLRLPDSRVLLVCTSPSRPYGRPARVIEAWLRHSGWARPEDSVYLGPAPAGARDTPPRMHNYPPGARSACAAPGPVPALSQGVLLTLYRNLLTGGWCALRLGWSEGEAWWAADPAIACAIRDSARFPAVLVTPGVDAPRRECLRNDTRITRTILWNHDDPEAGHGGVQVLNVSRVGAVRLHLGSGPPRAETAIR